MNYRPENPVIVQSDMSVLLETMGPLYEPARDFLGQFAELRKSPEYLHTYHVTPLSLWNAASAGLTLPIILDGLKEFSKYDIPPNVITEIREQMARFGRVKLLKAEGGEDLILQSADAFAVSEILTSPQVRPFVERQLDESRILIKAGTRGRVKQALIKIGYPVEDLAGYVDGDALEIGLRDITLGGTAIRTPRVPAGCVGGFSRCRVGYGGEVGCLFSPAVRGRRSSGWPCMSRVSQNTLILTTNITALRQWRSELLDKTTLGADQIGEYSGEVKDVKPVTLTTYQILTYKKHRHGDFLHMDLFQKFNWGLIVYDEVHMLPAPVFRAVAEIQARRPIGADRYTRS